MCMCVSMGARACVHCVNVCALGMYVYIRVCMCACPAWMYLTCMCGMCICVSIYSSVMFTVRYLTRNTQNNDDHSP